MPLKQALLTSLQVIRIQALFSVPIASLAEHAGAAGNKDVPV
jgi:hypothetical protein